MFGDLAKELREVTAALLSAVKAIQTVTIALNVNTDELRAIRKVMEGRSDA